MSLSNLIQSVPGWQTKGPQQLHSELSTASILVEDHEPYTWAGVASVIGAEASEALRMALDSAGLGWVNLQLGGLGVDLAHPDSQSVLLGLSAAVPGLDVLANHVKKQVSPLEQAGIEATLDDVAEALDDLLNPNVPDAWSYEVLVSLNRQADGETNAFASVTRIGLRDGKIVQRHEPVRHINGALRDALLPLVEDLINA